MLRLILYTLSENFIARSFNHSPNGNAIWMEECVLFKVKIFRSTVFALIVVSRSSTAGQLADKFFGITKWKTLQANVAVEVKGNTLGPVQYKLAIDEENQFSLKGVDSNDYEIVKNGLYYSRHRDVIFASGEKNLGTLALFHTILPVRNFIRPKCQIIEEEGNRLKVVVPGIIQGNFIQFDLDASRKAIRIGGLDKKYFWRDIEYTSVGDGLVMSAMTLEREISRETGNTFLTEFKLSSIRLDADVPAAAYDIP
jgi:hypothetical protein